jgi:hypothetical protein
VPLVYNELRALVSREWRHDRLQVTTVVNEAYLRLFNQREVDWQNRGHFFGIAAQLMRRILIDHARHRTRQKRGGVSVPAQLDEALTVAADQVDAVDALDLQPDGERRAAWMAGLARALENAGRPAEAADACLEAAREANDVQRIEWLRKAAEQVLVGGHIDRGIAIIDSVLPAIGMRPARSPRGALASILLRRGQLRWRGLDFAPRDAARIAAEDLLRIDTAGRSRPVRRWSTTFARRRSTHGLSAGPADRSRISELSSRVGKVRGDGRAVP